MHALYAAEVRRKTAKSILTHKGVFINESRNPHLPRKRSDLHDRQERAKFITDKLGGYTDQEIKINDGVIQSYKDIKGAIEDAMTAARARATLHVSI